MTRPIVAEVTLGPSPESLKRAAPAPVTVHCAVGGFCPPYSVG